MKNFRSSVGYSILMLTVGMFPLIFAVILTMFAPQSEAAVCLPAALMKMHSRGRCVSFQPMSPIVRA